MTQKTMLRFTWHLVANDFSESFDVSLLHHHAVRRGVHLPKSWKNRLNLGLGLPAVDALSFYINPTEGVRPGCMVS